MTKEYMSRHDKPIVNPGFTLEEYENNKISELKEQVRLDSLNPYGPKSNAVKLYCLENNFPMKDLDIDWNTYAEHGILVFETKE